MSEPGSRVSTGIGGLDDITHGGFIEHRSYLLHGHAGAGKTITAFHFLQAGVERGESAVFINLEESLPDLKANARSLGFDVDEMEFVDLSPSAEAFTGDEQYEVFAASEVEQEPLTETIVESVQKYDPDRVVVDPVTQLHYLTSGEYQFRKQVVGFMRFLRQQGTTVLFTAQETDRLPTEDLQFLSDGTILLEIVEDTHRVTIDKFRGSAIDKGEHAYRIDDDGITVFPELRPGDVTTDVALETISSGVEEVDELLHGGLERGTVTVISGPTGVGKTTLGSQFTNQAASRGERSVIYLFEESERTFVNRNQAIGIPVEEMREAGTLEIEVVEPLELSPQEFGQKIRNEVQTRDTRMVMIDGIRGYRMSLRGDSDNVTRRLHALGRFLKAAGVTVILVDETSQIVGPFQATEDNISYLADNLLFLRHLEIDGSLQKAIGVLKKRMSDYERSLRQFKITGDGVVVGEPMTDLRGILGGTPEYVGSRND